MRIGVIRGDLPGPIFIGDLEPTTQTNFPVEPAGQTRYIARPDPTALENVLSLMPSSIGSTSDITFPLTIDNSNHTLRLRVAASGSYTVVTIANAAYADITALVAAVNTALASAGIAAEAVASSEDPAYRIALRNTDSFGPGAAIGIDSVGNGSTANTPLALGSGARSVTFPSASTLILVLSPIGGPLDVSLATVLANAGVGLSTLEVNAIADMIAPQFVETNVALESFKTGNIAGLLSANFNPDPTRRPPISPGAAVTVVEDDGFTVFTVGLPDITSAAIDTPNTGDVTITGTDMGNSEQELVTVKFTGAISKSLPQKIITTTNTGGTQGVVSATEIVIPASLIPGVTSTTTSVQVKFDSYASNIEPIA